MLKPYYDHNGIQIFSGNCLEILPTLAAAEHVLVTDPPYGVALHSGWNGAHGDCAIVGDEDTSLRDAVAHWAASIPAILFGSPAVQRPIGATADRVLIWDKGGHVGMGDLSWPWKPNYEEIYVLGEGYSGPRTSSVLRYDAIAGTVALTVGRFHPMQKPVGLMKALIQKCPSGIILDPFMGSGTTLVAAKQLGRRAIGIELDERYVNIAIDRLQQEVLDLC